MVFHIPCNIYFILGFEHLELKAQSDQYFWILSLLQLLSKEYDKDIDEQ
jgi:hypothetical protein